MKTNFRVLALGVGVASLALWVALKDDQTNFNMPLLADAATAATLSPDVADVKSLETPAKPGETVPVVKNEAPPTPALPPGSVVITNPAATNVAATNIVQTPPAAQPPQLSPALAEIVRLLQANVSQEILMTFITNSTQPFYVGASEIVYLHDLGAPDAIVAALIKIDASPEMAARKQAAIAVKPLPPGVALTEPATNIFPTRAATPQRPPNPPDPVPVNPPPNEGSALAPPPPDTEVTYDYPAPTTEVTYNYFYTSLAPYGSWIDVPGYGYSWRPTCATWNPAWRPYVDGGRWLWSNHGWYWYSDYSWGWAPFHYGRWCRPAGYGWVWVPDTVWGPSWVSWRYSPNYCGWAPLPPSARFVSGLGFYFNTGSVGIGFEFGLGVADYCYVPTARFCDRWVSRHALPHHHNHGIHKNTTVINNYVVGNNNTIVNHGAGLDKISKATRGDVKQVTLRDTTFVKNLGTRHDRLESDGKTLTVHRPPAAVLARKSTVSSLAPTVTATTRPSTYSNPTYTKPAPAVSGSSHAVSVPAGVSTAPAAGMKGQANSAGSHHTPVIMNSRASGPTPVTRYTKPANAASQPVIVTGGTLPDISPYAKPGNAEVDLPGAGYTKLPGGASPRVTKPDAASVSRSRNDGHHSVVSSSPDQNAKPSSGYTKPASGSGSATHITSLPGVKNPSASAYNKPSPAAGHASSVGSGSAAPRSSGYARTEPSRGYTQPSAQRAPVTHAPSPSYSKPAPSAPSQSYSRPAPSYSAPARSEGHHSRVTVPSGGGGGSQSRSSGNPSGSSDGRKGR